MSRMVNLFAPVALTLVLSGLAIAQAPAVQTLPPSAALTPVEVPPAEAGLSEKSMRLNVMESELAIALKGLQLDSTNAQRNDLSAKVNGIRQGTNQVPELIGLSGVGGVYRAQFLAGNAMVDVGVGDWVSADWRVYRMSGSGVELSKRGSDQRHQVLFGQRPVSSKEIAADIAAAANAANQSPVSSRSLPPMSQ